MKNITSSSWNARNIPEGITFDKDNGIFSGSPVHDEGEFSVPVSVKTNYGEDSKDVRFIVLPHSEPVYAIGSQAAKWSNNAEQDAYGFRKLNIPDAYSLVPHLYGFGAKIPNGDYFCCGYYDISQLPGISMANSLWFKKTDSPLNLGKVAACQFGLVQNVFTQSKQKILSSCSYFLKLLNDGSLMLKSSVTGSYNFNTKNSSLNHGLGAEVSFLPQNFFLNETGTLAVYTQETGISWLADNGNSIYTFVSSSDDFSEEPLPFRAVKRFSFYGSALNSSASSAITKPDSISPAFEFLTDNGLLDNNPDSFPHGIIKDAWVWKRLAFVSTVDGKVYEYNFSAKLWTDVFPNGYLHPKKIIISSSSVFILTEGGELFHRGSSIDGITEAHSAFTWIFQNLFFSDAEFDASTLTVLLKGA